jgi:hypothetical protein
MLAQQGRRHGAQFYLKHQKLHGLLFQAGSEGFLIESVEALV